MANAAEQPSPFAPTHVKSLAVVSLITYLKTLAMTFFTYLKMILSNMIKKKLTTILDFAVTIKKTWVDDPRTSTHSLKVALAVTLISMVYYIRALYKGGPGDAGICATVTVIGVFDYTVVHKIVELAHRQFSAIGFSVLVCIVIFVCVFPVWADEDLQKHMVINLENIASFLEGFGGEYYRVSDGDKPLPKEAYKSILDFQATEESLQTGCASWELGHGKFGFGHPWEQYLKIGVYTRQCSYHIKALSGYLDAKNKVEVLIDSL
ncbi:putative aluminum-activated malate transporter [Helianthus debilis subsp. tardiflorus]